MTVDRREPHPVMSMLSAGIPLTLLIDVFAGSGRPASRAIYRDEAGNAGWLRRSPAA